jgi:ribosomal protein S12 methylthiotransferase
MIGRRIQVLVDEIDEEGAIARSQGDAPDVDGLVYIADGHELEVGEFAEVDVVDCDVHDLHAQLSARIAVP